MVKHSENIGNVKRELSIEELTNLNNCLSTLKTFLISSFGMGTWKLYEEDDKVGLCTLVENSFHKNERVGFIYNIKDDTIGSSYLCGRVNKFKNFESKAQFSIRVTLRELSKLSIGFKTIDFCLNSTYFSRGLISESRSEKGSYDLELW